MRHVYVFVCIKEHTVITSKLQKFFYFTVDAKAEIMDLQGQMASLKEKNAVLETTNQNVRRNIIQP